MASLPLQVVHQFTAAGTANFRCQADDVASAGAIKITGHQGRQPRELGLAGHQLHRR